MKPSNTSEIISVTSDKEVRVTRNTAGMPMDQKAIEASLLKKGLHFYQWSNGPNDLYSSHHHGYHKIIFVVRGTITFGLPECDQKITLNAGDRLDLPAGVEHNAQVGKEGVICIEAHQG